MKTDVSFMFGQEQHLLENQSSPLCRLSLSLKNWKFEFYYFNQNCNLCNIVLFTHDTPYTAGRPGYRENVVDVEGRPVTFDLKGPGVFGCCTIPRDNICFLYHSGSTDIAVPAAGEADEEEFPYPKCKLHLQAHKPT